MVKIISIIQLDTCRIDIVYRCHIVDRKSACNLVTSSARQPDEIYDVTSVTFVY